MTELLHRREWTPDIRNSYALVAVLPALALLAVFAIYPLVLLVIESSRDGFEAYGRVLSSRSGQKAIVTTFTASLAVTVIVMVVSSIIGWTIRTTPKCFTIWATPTTKRETTLRPRTNMARRCPRPTKGSRLSFYTIWATAPSARGNWKKP